MPQFDSNEPAPNAGRSKLGRLLPVLAGVLALAALGYVFHSRRGELARALDFDARVLTPMLLMAFVAQPAAGVPSTKCCWCGWG
jgi:hypothetical protein